MLIKYIKSVLWRVAKCLSYIEEARRLKVKHKIELRSGLNQAGQKKNILPRTLTLTRTHNTRLHCSIIYLELKYIGCHKHITI